MLKIELNERNQGITIYAIGDKKLRLPDMTFGKIDKLVSFVTGYKFELPDDVSSKIEQGKGGFADVILLYLVKSSSFIADLMNVLFEPEEKIAAEWVRDNVGPRDVRAAGRQLIQDNDVKEIYDFIVEKIFPFFQATVMVNMRKNLYELPHEENEELPGPSSIL